MEDFNDSDDIKSRDVTSTRRRSSREKKVVQRYSVSDDSESDTISTKRKRKSNRIISDSENEFEEEPIASKSDKNTARPVSKKGSQDNKFRQFGFIVTDKKTAVASMASGPTASARPSRESRSWPTSRNGNKSSSGRPKRRSGRSIVSVNYAEPSDEESSGAENSSGHNDDMSGTYDSAEESPQALTRLANPSRSSRAKSNSASSRGGGGKGGTRSRQGDSLVSLPPQGAASSRRRSVANIEKGLPERQISYADPDSGDDMFHQTSSDDEKRPKKSRRGKMKKGSAGADGDSSDGASSSKKSATVSGEGSSSDDSDYGEGDTFHYSIQHILGAETRTAAEWVPVCEAIETREVTRGSVWQQPDDEFFSSSDVPITKYLIKWKHASFLHLSWEKEDDLVAMVGSAAKTQIKRFRDSRRHGVVLFDDLRNGEYFPPNFLVIDRILDVDDEKVEMTSVDWDAAPLPPPHGTGPDMAERSEADTGIDGDCDELKIELGTCKDDIDADPDGPEGNEAKDIHEVSPEDAMLEEAEATSSRRRVSTRNASAVARVMLAAMASGSNSTPNTTKRQTRRGAAQARRRRNLEESNDEGDGTKRAVKKAASTPFPYLHSNACFVTVKWESLPYGESSFEDINDLINYGIDFEKAMRMFYQREQSTPSKNSRRSVKRKLEGELLQSDNGPEFQAGELRDYQWTGVRWLLFNWSQRRNAILADEMGLGKTIQTAAFLHILKNYQGVRGPFLIVAPLSTIVQWQREVSAWTNLDAVIYHGSQDDREITREYEFFYNSKKKSDGYKMEVIITTPETCTAFDSPKASRLSRELSKVHWDLLVVDEAHKLKNYSSKLSTTLRDEYSFSNCVLLTGTPLQNSTEELWTLLNFVDNNAFQHHSEFAAEFGDLKDSTQLAKLQKKLGPYLLRRQKEHVEKSVPPKEEIIVEVELTVPQKQYYRAIFEQNKNFLFRGATKDGPRLTNLAMELRKCCNHPYLIRGAEAELIKHYTSEDAEKSHVDMMVESSGKLVLLDKLLPKLRDDGHRVLIFSQFRIMLDILEDYLNMRFFTHERIDGAVTGKKRQAAIDKFSGPDSNIFVMLLSTRAGGVGINLTAADTVIIFDSDWNPQNDIQAQARAHRIGQTQCVKVYRLLTSKTYEMEMFRAASMKLGLDYAIMHNMKDGEKKSSGSSLSTKELEALLKHGAYDIFREEQEGNSEKISRQFCEAGIDSILERSMVVMHGGDGAQKPTANFSKASFVATGGDNLDVNDPDFWTKIVGLNVVDDDADDMPRKRKCKEVVGSYSEPTKADELFLADSDSDFSDDGQSVAAKKARAAGSTDKGKRKKFDKAVVAADWTPDNLNILMAALVTHGYGNWEAIRMTARLHYSLADIAKGCRDLVLFMTRVCCFSRVGHEVTQLVGNQFITHRIQPGDPVDNYDNAASLMSLVNDRPLIKLAFLSHAVQKKFDTISESDLPFLRPISSGDQIDTIIMETLFLHPSSVPASYHYVTHSNARWESAAVSQSLAVLRQLPLSDEFTNYESYLCVGKPRSHIATKLSILEDLFAMFHAVQLDNCRKRLPALVSDKTPAFSQPAGAESSFAMADSNTSATVDDAKLRALIPYPFKANAESLEEFLMANLVVEDSPSDWWVTGQDDVLLLHGIMKYGMPDKVSRLNAIEKFMGAACPGPRHRPLPTPCKNISDDCFLIGGQGYLQDDAKRNVVEAEFFLDKGDIMKRVKEIIFILRGVANEKRVSYFQSEVMKAMTKYGVPTDQLEDAGRRYREGCREFGYFQAIRSIIHTAEGVADDAGGDGAKSEEKSMIVSEQASAPGNDSGLLKDDDMRLQFLPTWKGLALLTECNIVRLNELRRMVTGILNLSTSECPGVNKSTLLNVATKAKHISHVRLFLFCYGEVNGARILEKMAAGAPETTCTLWWTPSHDVRLLKLLLKHGWGSWKAMCDDSTPELIVTAVPKGFVVPPREMSADIASSVTGRIVIEAGMLSSRVQYLCSGLSFLLKPPKPPEPQRPAARLMLKSVIAPQVTSERTHSHSARPALPLPKPSRPLSSSNMKSDNAFTRMMQLKPPPADMDKVAEETLEGLDEFEVGKTSAARSTAQPCTAETTASCAERLENLDDTKRSTSTPAMSTTTLYSPSSLTVASGLAPHDSTTIDLTGDKTEANRVDTIAQERTIDQVVIDIDCQGNDTCAVAAHDAVVVGGASPNSAVNSSPSLPEQQSQPKMKTITSFFHRKANP